MKPLLTNVALIRSRIAATLIAAAAALTISALFAQSPTPTVPRGACKTWADELKKDQSKKDKLRRAFVTAIRESAKTTTEGKAVREKLLASSDSARDAILAIFAADTNPPIFDVNFPAESWFKFYEPEMAVTKGMSKRTASGQAEEHCLHIFYLPEPGTDLSGLSDDKIFFDEFFKCCYEPW